MVRVTGPSIGALDRSADAYTANMLRSVRLVLSQAASAIDVRMPTIDDIALITDRWTTMVDRDLLGEIGDAYAAASDMVYGQLRSELLPTLQAAISEMITEEPIPPEYGIPQTNQAEAEIYLATVRNRIVGVSDDVWFYAREELLEGLRLGEGIPELRTRVVKSAQLSEWRAERVARTEINGASNAGAIDQIRATGLPADKSWLATGGPRTRPTHRDANGQTVPVAGSFVVGGFPMDRPHDPAGPAQEVVLCRCTLTFDLLDEGVTARREQLREAS